MDETENLKAALGACEDKWYNAGFMDAENSAKLIVHKARKLGFQEGWMASLQAMGVSNDSPLRNPEQIPFPEPPPVQNPANASDKDTPGMRELMQEIDSHVEAIDLEVTSTPKAQIAGITPTLPSSAT